MNLYSFHHPRHFLAVEVCPTRQRNYTRLNLGLTVLLWKRYNSHNVHHRYIHHLSFMSVLSTCGSISILEILLPTKASFIVTIFAWDV